MRNLFQKLYAALSAGEDAVLVTVVASSGSTPRGAGARMLVTRQGRQAGTIGGGAVEYRSEQLGKEILETRTSRMEHFRLHENEVQDLGMICGGDVDVWFHYLPAGDVNARAVCQAVEDLYRKGEQSWLLSEMGGGASGALAVYGEKSGTVGAEIPMDVLGQLSSRATQIQAGARTFYCEQLCRAGRVYIFGGGHVAQSLVPALAAVEFRCMVLEDRPDFARPELFPGVEETRLIQNDNDAVYDGITEDDYICIMTRGHKGDLTVQAHALKTPARYIGVIGSRRKKESVFARLRAMGYTDADLARITTPIGLNIQAETPAEIAVSIAGQLIQVRAQRDTGTRPCNWDKKDGKPKN